METCNKSIEELIEMGKQTDDRNDLQLILQDLLLRKDSVDYGLADLLEKYYSKL